jgi:hypothetical protein
MHEDVAISQALDCLDLTSDTLNDFCCREGIVCQLLFSIGLN